MFSLWAQLRGNIQDLRSNFQLVLEVSSLDDTPILSRMIDATEGANVMLLFNIIKDFGSQHEFLFGATLQSLYFFDTT